MCQVFIYDYCCYRFILTQRIILMKVNVTDYLNSYLLATSGEHAEKFIEIGLARMVYVNWTSENGFIRYEGDHLDPDLEHFPEMLEAFRELADKNPLLCAFLLLGRENDYLARKKQAEEYMKQEKKGTRGRKKTSK